MELRRDGTRFTVHRWAGFSDPGLLRRLAQGQLVQFPDVIEAVQERTSGRLAEALADRLARLSLSGRPRRCDPAVAAEQFLALPTAPMETRSGLGARKVAAADVRAIADAAVDTFLRAYAAGVVTAEPGLLWTT